MPGPPFLAENGGGSRGADGDRCRDLRSREKGGGVCFPASDRPRGGAGRSRSRGLEEGMSSPNPDSALAVDPDEVVEIEGPVSAAALQRSEPSAAVDPVEYASMLKEKLDLYCAAVAFSRVLSPLL